MSSSTIHPWVQLHVEHQKESKEEVTVRLQFKGPSEWSLSLPLQIPHYPRPDFTIALNSPEPDSLNHPFPVMSTVHMTKCTNSFRKYLSYRLQHTNPSSTRDPNQYPHSIAHADTSIWVQKHYRHFHAVPGFV